MAWMNEQGLVHNMFSPLLKDQISNLEQMALSGKLLNARNLLENIKAKQANFLYCVDTC